MLELNEDNKFAQVVQKIDSQAKLLRAWKLEERLHVFKKTSYRPSSS